MNKTMIGLVLSFLIVVAPVYASSFGGSTVRAGSCQQVITAVTLDDDPTTTTSAAVDISPGGKISFLLQVAETDPGGSVDPQASWSIDLSPDNSTFLTNFDVILNSAGTDAPVATVNMNPGDGNTLQDFIYIPGDFAVKYARIQAECAATPGGSATCDADETLVVDAWLCTQS